MNETAPRGAVRPTRDQRRARHAWNAVGTIAAGRNAAKEFGHARKLPARILASGLGPALAFVKAKGEAPGILSALGSWVLEEVPAGSHAAGHTDLLRAVIEEDSRFLRLATAESVSYLVWFNRFAEAEGVAAGEVG